MSLAALMAKKKKEKEQKGSDNGWVARRDVKAREMEEISQKIAESEEKEEKIMEEKRLKLLSFIEEAEAKKELRNEIKEKLKSEVKIETDPLKRSIEEAGKCKETDDSDKSKKPKLTEGEEQGASEPTEFDNQCTTIRSWIYAQLDDREAELQSLPESERNSADGKQKLAQFEQTKADIKPLLKRLKHRFVDVEVAAKLSAICKHCEKKEYKAAHHAFIDIAIGNAPWPMGVTAVGLHERAAQTRIMENQLSHIMNDETTRRFIQMFKRLMTHCQRRHPTDDPAQMVTLSTNKD